MAFDKTLFLLSLVIALASTILGGSWTSSCSKYPCRPCLPDNDQIEDVKTCQQEEDEEAISPVSLHASDVVPAISSCGNGKKLVALTFDDGPEIKYTDLLREELDRLGVKATFFMMTNAKSPEHCAIAQRLVQSGHELQLHSMSHPHCPDLTMDQLDWEVRGGIEWMESCGLPRPNMFRPPYGELLPDQARYLYDTYQTIIAQWNVESDDFKTDWSQDKVFNEVRERFEQNVGVGNSAVILMHDRYAAARSGIVTRVVKYFRKHGYTFVTMNHCYEAGPGLVSKGSGGPSPYRNVYVP